MGPVPLITLVYSEVKLPPTSIAAVALTCVVKLNIVMTARVILLVIPIIFSWIINMVNLNYKYLVNWLMRG